MAQRNWLVLLLSLAVAAGLVVWVVAAGFFSSPEPVPRIETFEATVISVTADQDGVAIEREDGTQEGFTLDEATEGVDLLRAGSQVVLDVAYLPDSALVIEVHSAS